LVIEERAHGLRVRYLADEVLALSGLWPVFTVIGDQRSTTVLDTQLESASGDLIEVVRLREESLVTCPERHSAGQDRIVVPMGELALDVAHPVMILLCVPVDPPATSRGDERQLSMSQSRRERYRGFHRI